MFYLICWTWNLNCYIYLFGIHFLFLWLIVVLVDCGASIECLVVLHYFQIVFVVWLVLLEMTAVCCLSDISRYANTFWMR